jgi:hypothetical protein
MAHGIILKPRFILAMHGYPPMSHPMINQQFGAASLETSNAGTLADVQHMHCIAMLMYDPSTVPTVVLQQAPSGEDP